MIVHDHGIWLPSNRAVAKFCCKNNIIRIVSPRGMLSNWSLNHSRLKKRIVWWLYQRRDLKSADGFHATSQLEADELRQLGFNQPAAVIPNGVSFPSEMPTRTNFGKKTALFLSRIHPKKNLLNLVRAWKNANPPNHWELVIAGPNENGHQQVIESEIAKLEIQEQVRFVGSINDSDKWKFFANADLFVLPSYSENFGIVVAEALAAGIPVIATTGTPWSVLNEQHLGWQVAPTVEGIQSALEQALRMGEAEAKSIAERAKIYSNENYCWRNVGREMRDFYTRFV